MRLRFWLHGVRFSIDTDAPLAGRLATSIMPGCLLRRRGTDRSHAAFAVKDSPGRLEVFRGRRRLWDVRSEAELIPWLEAEVVGWLLDRLGRYGRLHAAVAERRGRAVVIAGRPDAGKTSLACALGLAGWGIMSDEVALLEPGGKAVRSFPRAMLVKSGTARRLKELLRFPPRRVTLDNGPESVRYVNPALIGGAVRARARIVAVVFPERARTCGVTDVGELEATERLLSASFDAASRGRRAVEMCVGLARSVPRFRLRVGDLRQGARILGDAVGV